MYTVQILILSFHEDWKNILCHILYSNFSKKKKKNFKKNIAKNELRRELRKKNRTDRCKRGRTESRVEKTLVMGSLRLTYRF